MSDSVRAEFQELVPTVVLLNNFGSSESGFNGTATADSGPEKGFRVQVNARTAVVDPVTYEPVAPGRAGPYRPARTRAARLLQRPRQDR